jgi:hypothetical protein
VTRPNDESKLEIYQQDFAELGQMDYAVDGIAAAFLTWWDFQQAPNSAEESHRRRAFSLVDSGSPL